MFSVELSYFYGNCPMLGFCTKIKTNFSSNGMYSVFVGLVTQLCSPSNACVDRGHTLCAYMKPAHFPSSPSSAHSVFTALWCGSVVN